METHIRQHYVPNGILKNFGIKKPNGKFEVCLIDLFNFKAEYRNTQSAMYAKNIYDGTDGDVKTLEKKFNTEIETPMFEIVDRLLKNTNEAILTRKELIIIKKYMLIQIFRSVKNMTAYCNPPNGMKEMSDYNIKDGESKLDFWKREMRTILDSDWDTLIDSTDLVSVKVHAQTIHKGFLMFFKTNEEFMINDLGVVTERLPLEIPKSEHEEFIKIAKDLGENIFGTKDFDKTTEGALKKNTCYIDTGIWMPLSSNLAVVNVHELLKNYLINPKKSKIQVPLFLSKLLNHLSLPKNTYVNQAVIETDLVNMIKEHASEFEKLPKDEAHYLKTIFMSAAITKNKHDGDQYTYEVHGLDADMTIYWNTLLMNEAFQFLCFKTPEKANQAIQVYNHLKANGLDNMKKDYTGFIDLLKTIAKREENT